MVEIITILTFISASIGATIECGKLLSKYAVKSKCSIDSSNNNETNNYNDYMKRFDNIENTLKNKT